MTRRFVLLIAQAKSEWTLSNHTLVRMLLNYVLVYVGTLALELTMLLICPLRMSNTEPQNLMIYNPITLKGSQLIISNHYPNLGSWSAESAQYINESLIAA